MHALVMALALWGGSSDAAKLDAAALDDGSLVFLENCNYFVEQYTKAPIGHVAIAANDDGTTWLYEATPGRVRRLTWSAYRDELAAINADRLRKKKSLVKVHVLQPAEPLNRDQQAALRSLLESQLDRPYSVKGIVRGKRNGGIHCAELAAHTLNATSRANIEECHKQSPADVLAIARGTSKPTYVVAIVAEVAEEEPWCDRAWRKWSQWSMLCRWSCREAWAFCW
jgi:hypothetical protein